MFLRRYQEKKKKKIEEATVLPLVVVEEHPVEITEARGAGNAWKKEEKHEKSSAAIPSDKS